MAVKYAGGWVWVVSWQRDGRWVAAEGMRQLAAWTNAEKLAFNKAPPSLSTR